MNRLSTTVFAALLVTAPALVQADVLGLTAGAGLWRAEPSGDIRYRDNERFDVQDDLDLETEDAGYGYLAIEHPVPLLPNVRLETTPLEFQGDGRVENDFTFEDFTYTAGTEVVSRVDLDQRDVVLYYELLDTLGAQVDLGVNVRFLDGVFQVRDKTTGDTDRVSVDTPLPMLYAAAQIDFPGTGLALRAEGSGVAYDGSNLLDLRAGASYLLPFGLGVEAGYRRISLDLDDVDGVSADLEFSGPYAGLRADF